MAEQSYANHTKFYAPFHFFVLPALAVNFVWSIVHWRTVGFSFGGFIGILTAAALVMLALSARLMALKVQDRLIRLEERIRLERLLPNELRMRIPEFTINQLVALRFSSDDELPLLAKRVLDEKLRDRKIIKSYIKSWRPDYQRA
jgi:hypothetical protein